MKRARPPRELLWPPTRPWRCCWRKGLVADAEMICDMARTVGWTKLVRQIVTLRRMRVR